jgi:hypothetical protein
MRPRISLFADASSTVPLRFDDAEFMAALESDDRDRDEGDKSGPLAQLLGVSKASEFAFDDFAADGWTIHARQSITGQEEDTLFTNGQRAGGGVDLAAFNQYWYSVWALRVTLGDDAELDTRTKAALAGLCSPNRKVRADAYGALPSVVRNAFRARLRAHVDAASRPAARDPQKTAPLVPGE